MGNHTELIDNLDNNDDILNEDIREDNEDKTKNEYIGRGILDSYESLDVFQSSGSKYYNHDLNTYFKDPKKEFSVVQG